MEKLDEINTDKIRIIAKNVVVKSIATEDLSLFGRYLSIFTPIRKRLLFKLNKKDF